MEEYQVVKRGKEYQSCGEEYKKGQGKQYHLSYNIEAVGKNIKWGKGKGMEISAKKIKILENRWESISC